MGKQVIKCKCGSPLRRAQDGMPYCPTCEARRSVEEIGLSESEWSAWQAVVKEFRGIVGDINDKKYDPLVKLLRLWGERLAVFRRSQTVEQVKMAIDCALRPRGSSDDTGEKGGS